MKIITRGEEAEITRRLLASMPASRFEMDTVTRLAAIKVTREVPSAAVETSRNPRLLINPDFVTKFCQRDEHLFLLVMHELWHILLAHTRLTPHMTPAHNIAFDAIINAELMRVFRSPDFMGFFDRINPPDKFPHCLLRPPVGWPDKPEYSDIGPPGTKELLKRLYPPGHFNRHSMPLYEEILRLLKKAGINALTSDIVLIGNHENAQFHDPVMREFFDEISERWPYIPGQGNGWRRRNNRRQYSLADNREEVRRVFARIIRQILDESHTGERTRKHSPVKLMGTEGFIPNARDRTMHARQQIGSPQLLWKQEAEYLTRKFDRPDRAFVYLDVSGSMNFMISHLLDLLLPYVARRQALIYQFSTNVRPLPWEELKSGLLATTGGTDINCVFEHLLQVKPAPRRVLIITDGLVGKPSSMYSQQIVDQRMALHIVLPPRRTLDASLDAIMRRVIHLPALHS
ncbi:MAG: DUF2201 family putative metallopeptidase [Chloroflexota bacterium]